MLKNVLIFGVIASLMVVFVGCGDGLAHLKGKVTFDGQPVSEGIGLEFIPLDSNTNVPASGRTDASGQYEAAFTFQKKGIQPGKYTVRLEPGTGGDGTPKLDENDQPINLPVFPKKYFQSIEEIEVTPGSNVKDFNLTSEAG